MQNRQNRRFSSLSRGVLGLAGILLVPGLAAVPVMPATATAQGVQVQFDKALKLITIDADRADVGRVMRAAFSQMDDTHVDLGRTGTTGISGNVTVHLRNASIDTFMRTVLDQVGASYTVSRNIYTVRPVGSTAPVTRDPVLPRGQVPGGATEVHADVRLVNATYGEAAKYISDRFRQRVQVMGDPTGRISLDLRDATFVEAVQALARGNGRLPEYEVVQAGGYINLVPRRDRNTGGNDGRGQGNPGTPGNVPAAFKKRVGLVVRDQAIGTVLSHLNIEAGVTLTLSREVPNDVRVSVRAGDEPLIDVLDKICRATRLKYNITGERSATISPISVVRPTNPGRDNPGRDQYGRCRNCRYDLRDEWKFCPMCGARLGR